MPADSKIPVLDLTDYFSGSQTALDALSNELRDALENVGFFYIVNQGIEQEFIDRAFASNRSLHAMPLAQKLEIEINVSLVGYMLDLGQKITSSECADGDKPDRGEAFFMTRDRGPDLDRSPNQWPRSPPQFRTTLVAYYKAMEALGLRLLTIFARALDLPADYFESDFGKLETLSFQRASHYPPDALEEGQYSCGPHTDWSFLPLLATTDVPGLEIRGTDGQWIKAPLWRGSFLVNSGDMLTRWSNGRFLSTPHRVINDSGADRYATPFFMQPDADAILECLPTCCGPENPPREAPIACADYLKWYFESNFAHYGDDAQATVG